MAWQRLAATVCLRELHPEWAAAHVRCALFDAGAAITRVTWLRRAQAEVLPARGAAQVSAQVAGSSAAGEPWVDRQRPLQNIHFVNSRMS